jgi:cytochrome c biogenesis protein ResB
LKRYPLPFTVRLIKFRKELYPGSQIARSYKSLVEIESDGQRHQALISMNKPLRFRRLTLFQASYSEAGVGRESSTFAVSQNSGRLLPYIASALSFLGLAIHFLVKMKKRESGDR